MTYLDLIIYIVGSVLAGVIIAYPIAFCHGRLFQVRRQETFETEILEAEFIDFTEKTK